MPTDSVKHGEFPHFDEHRARNYHAAMNLLWFLAKELQVSSTDMVILAFDLLNAKGQQWLSDRAVTASREEKLSILLEQVEILRTLWQDEAKAGDEAFVAYTALGTMPQRKM